MQDDVPFEPITGPLEAKSCLLANSIVVERQSNDRRAKRLAYYLEKEVPRALAVVSQILEPQITGGVTECSSETAFPNLEDEYDIDDTNVAIEAAKQGATPIMASHLRDLAAFFRELGQAMDPVGKSQLRLEFKQRNPGKPTDPYAKMLRDSRIHTRVDSALRQYPKLEAAVAHVVKELGISRSEVFRALNRGK